MLRHREAVWRQCYRFARGDSERCRDMVQEVYMLMWLKFDVLDTEVSEWQQRAWVRKVTRSVLVDLYRKEKPVEMLDEKELHTRETLWGKETATADSDMVDRLEEVMMTLNEEERRLMQMRFDGYDAGEVAAMLGIERGAVYQRYHRIILKLKRRFGTNE